MDSTKWFQITMMHMTCWLETFLVFLLFHCSFIEKSRIKSIESDVIDLYCLFHQRFIFTEDGLSDMVVDWFLKHT